RADDIVHERCEVPHDIAAARSSIVLVPNTFLGSSHQGFQPFEEIRTCVVTIQESSEGMGKTLHVTHHGRCGHAIIPMVEDDGPYTTPANVAAPRAYSIGSWRYRHGPASAAATGGQPRPPADASQRSGVTYGG